MMWLPPEVWLRIFSHLGPCSLLNAANVSHEWRALARDNSCWRRHYDRMLAHCFAFRAIHKELNSSAPRLCAVYVAAFLSPISDHTSLVYRFRRFAAICCAIQVPAGYNATFASGMIDAERHAWMFQAEFAGLVRFRIHEHIVTGSRCLTAIHALREGVDFSIVMQRFDYRPDNHFNYYVRDSDAEAAPPIGPYFVFALA